ncbi:hypothetical protein C8R44DRAFT_425185 [Mycena epipterygia]|nr:hypothetical protein C8R44DRAFT_425185 [Mycena epipterygia]
MSFPNPGVQSDGPQATPNLVHWSSSSSEVDWMSGSNVAAPPAYTQYGDDPPTYQESRRRIVVHPISLQDRFRIDESNRRQEMQLLIGVLLSIVLTLFLMDGLPMLGQPTSSMHVIRIYGWFTVALFLSILLVAISLLCRHWLNLDLLLLGTHGAHRVPETRFRRAKQHVMNCLIAFGSGLMYAMVICFGVGLVDFLWQLYPAFGMGIVTTCGIYGTGPVLSSFGHGPLFKVPMASWQFARAWTRGILRSAGNTVREQGRTGEETTQ